MYYCVLHITCTSISILFVLLYWIWNFEIWIGRHCIMCYFCVAIWFTRMKRTWSDKWNICSYNFAFVSLRKALSRLDYALTRMQRTWSDKWNIAAVQFCFRFAPEALSDLIWKELGLISGTLQLYNFASCCCFSFEIQ